MAQLKCNACGGVYDDLLRDGTRYFHACAPIDDPDTGILTPRPNRRDDNVLLDADTGNAIGIVAAGAGVAVLKQTPGKAPDLANPHG